MAHGSATVRNIILITASALCGRSMMVFSMYVVALAIWWFFVLGFSFLAADSY